MIRVFESFSGIGSQRMALKNIGLEHEVVCISEIDKHAIASYEGIHGKVNNLGDISKIDVDDVPDHDLFTYSFPCQDLSISGKGAGLMEGTRSGLLYECKKIIENKKPKYLLMENVKNLISKTHKPKFDEWLNYLESLGYKNYWDVLNAKDFGIPQNRERVFVVSIRKDIDIGDFSFNCDNKPEVELSCFLEDDVDESLIVPMESLSGFVWIDGDRPESVFIREGTTKGYAEASVGDSFNFEYPNSTTRRGRVGKKKINTIMTTCNHIFVDKRADKICLRRFSALECWRLMGFSDSDYMRAKESLEKDFYKGFNRSSSQLYKQAGNSIVVPVLEAIFKNMFKEVL